MTKEIADLLGVKVGIIAKAIQWIAALVGLLAFLIFFALSPLHALILSGLLMVLGSFFFKTEKDIQKAALYIGAGLILIGIAGIFVPQIASQLLSMALDLRELIVFPA